jgi:hypothetical protein
MKRFFILFALAAVAATVTFEPADAKGRGGFGGGRGFGRGASCGLGGLGFVGGFGGDCGWDLAELYRELLNNVPYFALHPPVYYSEVVPRTYGYSPFAYPPGVMTPDLACAPQPVTITNPYVPATKPATAPASTGDSDRAASVPQSPEPLVVINPYVPQRGPIAQTAH